MSIPILENLLREFRGEVLHCDPCGAELVLTESEAALVAYSTYGGSPRVPLRRRATAAMGWAFLRAVMWTDPKTGVDKRKEVWACRRCFDLFLTAPHQYPDHEELERAKSNRERQSQPEVVE